MEDRAWDEVNDYINYLYLFFDEKQTSLDSNYMYYKYGAVIWAMYLSKRFGDDILKDIWENIYTTRSIEIEDFDTVIPIGLSEAYG